MANKRAKAPTAFADALASVTKIKVPSAGSDAAKVEPADTSESIRNLFEKAKPTGSAKPRKRGAKAAGEQEPQTPAENESAE